jgi:predicted transcriptional regulator
MDPDVDVVWDYYKHLFPEFSIHHAIVYKLLWRIEPLAGEDIAKEISISKTTVYRILHDLVSSGLVARTNFKPIRYYANSPVKAYNSNLKKVLAKLEKGAEKLEALIGNSSGLSGELYLIKRDGGQQRLVLKQSRALLNDSTQLLQIKKVVEEQLKEAEKQKLKTCAIYK